MLAAALGLGTSVPLLLVVAGLFVQPMQAELGWPRSTLAVGPLVGLLSAPCMPLAGPMVDRFGPRRVGLAGLGVLTIAYVLLAVPPMTKAAFFTIVLVMGLIAGPLTSAAVFTKRLAEHFELTRGTAFGLSMSGITLVAAVTIPPTTALIARSGWRAGFLALAALVAFVGIPAVALLLRDRTTMAPRARRVGYGLTEPAFAPLFRKSGFWVLFLATATGLPVGGILASLQPVLLAHGYEPKAARALVSVFAAAIAVSRFVGGFLLDLFWAPGIAAMFLILPAFGAYQLLHLSPVTSSWLLAAVVVWLLGFAEGLEVDCIGFFAARLFGVELYARLMGILTGTAYLSVSLGGMAFAATFDRWHSYDFALSIAIALYVIASLCFLSLGLLRIEPSEGHRSPLWSDLGAQ